MYATSKNGAKNNSRFWGVQGRSKSSMLIILNSLSPVMISSMSALICNRFHTIRAN